MKLAALAVAAAVVAGVSIAAEQVAPSKPAAPGVTLTVDTPLSVLLSDKRTAAVLEKALPLLVERIRTDEPFRQVFGDSTLRDLTRDPHVRGASDAVLTKLEQDLAAAQAPPD